MPNVRSRRPSITEVATLVLLTVLLWVTLSKPVASDSIAPSVTLTIPSGEVTVHKYPFETRGEWSARAALILKEMESQ